MDSSLKCSSQLALKQYQWILRVSVCPTSKSHCSDGPNPIKTVYFAAYLININVGTRLNLCHNVFITCSIMSWPFCLFQFCQTRANT